MSNIDKTIYKDIPFFRAHTSVVTTPKHMSAIDLLKCAGFLKKQATIDAPTRKLKKKFKAVKQIFIKNMLNKDDKKLSIFKELELQSNNYIAQEFLLRLKGICSQLANIAMYSQENMCYFNTIKVSTPNTPKKILPTVSRMADKYYFYDNILGERDIRNATLDEENICITLSFDEPNVLVFHNTHYIINKIELAAYEKNKVLKQLNKMEPETIQNVSPCVINKLGSYAEFLSDNFIDHLTIETILDLTAYAVSNLPDKSVSSLISRLSYPYKEKDRELNFIDEEILKTIIHFLSIIDHHCKEFKRLMQEPVYTDDYSYQTCEFQICGFQDLRLSEIYRYYELFDNMIKKSEIKTATMNVEKIFLSEDFFSFS